MRVAFFVGAFPMASETFVVNAARGVVAAGHDLTIHAMDPSIGGGAPLPDGAWTDGPAPPVLASDPPLTPRDRPAKLARAAASAARRGPSALPLLAPPRPAEARDAARALFDAEAVPRGRTYDVLHCQFAHLGPRVARLRRAGVVGGKLLVHCRGHDVAADLAARPGVARRLFAAADGVIANSEHFRQAAIGLGAREADSAVVPSGLDLSRFPLREGGRSPGPVRLLTVGRLVEKKGIDDLLTALASLDGGETLEILGDGPLRAALEGQARALSLSDRVAFRGEVSHDEVAVAMARADLFAAPSVTAASGDQDAGTNTLKEAMATGLPVVATRHGGIPELVRDGVDGILVAERDPQALADALRRLIAAPEGWAAMGRSGRARVEAGFSQDASARKLARVYEALTAGEPLSSVDRK